MTDCSKYEELCSLLMDGKISREDRRALEAHLAECPDCAAYLDDLRFLRESWRAIEEPGPATLHEDIMAKITAEAHKTVMPLEKRRRPMPVFTILAAAAACVMLVASGTLGNLFTGGTSTVPVSDLAPSMNADASAGADAPTIRAAQDLPQAESDGAESGGGPMLMMVPPPVAVTLPDALVKQAFAACYVAQGTGELPLLEDATLIEQDGTTSFFKVENNMSRLEKVSETLSQAGYAMVLREDLGAQIDEKASDALLVIVQE